MQTCLFRGEITTFCCVMRLESRDFSLIWALLHDFPPFSLQICAFVREKSCNPINFSRFARLQPQKVVISSSFWPAITTPRPCLHYLTIGMKKGKNVSTFFPFFSFYFRAAAVEFKREPPATSHLPRPTKPWTQNFSFRARRQGTSERSVLGRT